VTAEDIQRVMKKYFTETNRVVITYLPESMKPGAAAAKASNRTRQSRRTTHRGARS
jgi:hypothetical protein